MKPVYLSYFPILIFSLLVVALGAVMFTLGRILTNRVKQKDKDSAYECGFPTLSSSRAPFDLRYYLISIMFILFDLEVAFLLPWALEFKSLGVYGLVVMFIFLLILVVGFVYIWRKGALEWE